MDRGSDDKILAFQRVQIEYAFANLLPSVIEENAETVDKKLKIKG